MTVPPSLTSLSTPSPVAARSTAIYQAQIVDQNGVGIPAADLTTLTLSLFDNGTGSVVNGVSGANILNAGRGSVDAQGNLTITLVPDDTAVFGTLWAGRQQTRSMVIDWTYNGGASVGRHQVDFPILALSEA